MGIPVLWLLNNDSIEPPWGKAARISDDRYAQKLRLTKATRIKDEMEKRTVSPPAENDLTTNCKRGNGNKSNALCV